MTQSQFEKMKSGNPYSTEFGTVTDVFWWPSIVLGYSPDGEPPVVTATKEKAVVTTKEGESPELAGRQPLGGASLSSAMVGSLPSWPAFEAELRGALEAVWLEQQARLQQEQAAGGEPIPQAAAA
jgi:hypothetical protein